MRHRQGRDQSQCPEHQPEHQDYGKRWVIERGLPDTAIGIAATDRSSAVAQQVCAPTPRVFRTLQGANAARSVSHVNNVKTVCGERPSLRNELPRSVPD